MTLLILIGSLMVPNCTFGTFGERACLTGTEFQNRYAFTGRERDEDLGLYYYRARYYDPAEGRFVGADPLLFAAGDVNLYRYVGNSPALFTDPSGLIRWEGVATQITASYFVGISFIKFTLTSEWMNDRRATVTVLVAGPTIGTKGTAFAESKVAFEDHKECVDPKVFQPSTWGGLAVIYQGSLVGGTGISLSISKLGSTWSDGVLSWPQGYDIGASILYGSSSLWDISWETR